MIVDLSDSRVYAYENGALHGPFPRAEGDRLRVEVSGGVVRYKRNGTTFYTSTGTPTYPLLVDASLRTTGTTVVSAVV